MKTYDLKFLRFLTCYSSQGDVQFDMKKEACFSHIFYLRTEKLNKENLLENTYTIRVFYDGSGFKDLKNNHCFISLCDIKRYLAQGTKYHPFKYSIQKHKHYYDISVKIKGTHLAHKFILSYIRYLYESPFSLYLYEAIKLKKECEEFKTLDYLNIYNIISATVPCYNHGTDIHNIGKSYDFKELLSCEQIYNHIKNSKVEDCVNKIHTPINNKKFKIIDCDFHTNSIWRLKKYRQERIKSYLYNYNILKNLEQ